MRLEGDAVPLPLEVGDAGDAAEGGPVDRAREVDRDVSEGSAGDLRDVLDRDEGEELLLPIGRSMAALKRSAGKPARPRPGARISARKETISRPLRRGSPRSRPSRLVSSSVSMTGVTTRPVRSAAPRPTHARARSPRPRAAPRRRPRGSCCGRRRRGRGGAGGARSAGGRAGDRGASVAAGVERGGTEVAWRVEVAQPFAQAGLLGRPGRELAGVLLGGTRRHGAAHRRRQAVHVGRAADDEQVEVGGEGPRGVDGADVDRGSGPEPAATASGPMGVPVHRLVDDQCLHAASIEAPAAGFIRRSPQRRRGLPRRRP